MNRRYTLSCDGIDEYIYAVEDRIRKISGQTYDPSHQFIFPLRYYISTGRAGAAFLRRLLAIRPAYIARILVSGGSDDEIMEKIKTKIWKEGRA